MPQPQPSAPKVTVAIPTYNRAAFLRQTLAGIAAQRFPREVFEVLVIDNNSTDETRAVVAEFAGERPAPRHLLETKQGLDFARNRAVAEARGEIIVFGDDDILVETDWLAQMTAPLLIDTARRVGAVGGEPGFSAPESEKRLGVPVPDDAAPGTAALERFADLNGGARGSARA